MNIQMYWCSCCCCCYWSLLLLNAKIRRIWSTTTPTLGHLAQSDSSSLFPGIQLYPFFFFFFLFFSLFSSFSLPYSLRFLFLFTTYLFYLSHPTQVNTPLWRKKVCGLPHTLWRWLNARKHGGTNFCRKILNILLL